MHNKDHKKGRKHFKMPKQLDFSNSSDFVHTAFQPRLDVRIRKNMHKAARGCFGKITGSKYISKRHAVSDIQLHWCDVVASNGIHNDSVGNFCLRILEYYKEDRPVNVDASFYSI